MPKFEQRPKKGERPRSSEALVAVTKSAKCSVCQHDHREAIDRAIVSGTSYSEVARLFELGRKAISNHAKEHLSFNDAALQKIIEREASIHGATVEEGVQGAMRRRVLLESYLAKAMQDLVDGEVEIEPKDVVQIVGLLDKLDHDSADPQIEEIQLQFNSILQAINELIPGDMKDKISQRAKEIAQAEGYGLNTIEPTPIAKIPETIEATGKETDDAG